MATFKEGENYKLDIDYRSSTTGPLKMWIFAHSFPLCTDVC